MYRLTFTTTGVPEAIDEEAVEQAMSDAARARMRRKGGRRGENLIGVDDAAKEAAEAELQRQLDGGSRER